MVFTCVIKVRITKTPQLVRKEVILAENINIRLNIPSEHSFTTIILKYNAEFFVYDFMA